MNVEITYNLTLREIEYDCLMGLLGRLSLEKVLSLKMTPEDYNTLTKLYSQMSENKRETRGDYVE